MKFSTLLKWISVLLFTSFPLILVAQEDEAYYESLLKEEVEVLNPVYKPVIGIGTGYMNFFGEVRNKKVNPLSGSPAYKINVSTFIDSKRYLRANFFLLLGKMNGETRSAVDSFKNLNFETGITTFGINLHYDFKPFIKKGALVTPFISVGIENVQFNSKTDMFYELNGEKLQYRYMPDGTIRNKLGDIVTRDHNYETDLRDLNLNGLGSYNQSTLAIPIDAGLDFAVSDRVNMRLGYSFNYTFTDNIDNISSKATTGIKGNSMKDMFGFSYLTFHFDLFSSPKTITMQKLFADVEFDYSFYGDNDNDLIFDGWDQCPNTPPGVEVDSTGCPFDDDMDGVGNYMDKDLKTKPNAIVDNDGVEIDSDKLAEQLTNQQAISRSEVESFLMMQRARSRYNMGKSDIPIPQRYKRFDKDKDDYISFDELLDAIDEFFDESPDLKTPQDIYELNDFFFAQ